MCMCLKVRERGTRVAVVVNELINLAWRVQQEEETVFSGKTTYLRGERIRKEGTRTGYTS